LTEFPKANWGSYQAEFVLRTDAPVTHVVVFPFYGDLIVLAEIINRGWCTPSGHIEPGEHPEAAAHREAMEEAGIELGPLTQLGAFVLTAEDGTAGAANAYIATVTKMHDAPTGSDSHGRALFHVEDVSETYYHWDALLDAAFRYAWLRAQKDLRIGYPIPANIGDGGIPPEM
jgi:8-oxo-dGTP diphosphatase